MPKTKVTQRKRTMPPVNEAETVRFLCPFCPLSFKTKEHRNKHLVECTDTLLFCDLCAYNTTKRAYLNKHIKNVHCSVNGGKETSLDESGDELLEKHTDENNNETPSSSSKGSTQKGEKIIDDKGEDVSESDGNDTSTVNERTDPSKSLFEDISSDDDILYVKGNEPLSGNETPEKDSTGEIKDIKNSHGKQLEHNSSLEEGRTVRKATGPIPIFATKRKPKLQDLRQKLAKRLPPHLASTPKTEAKIRKVEEIQGSNKEPQMVTTYIKIITKFEKEGKRIKIVEKKVPA
jgi:hypothetical protein